MKYLQMIAWGFCTTGCSLFQVTTVLLVQLPPAPEHWQQSFGQVPYLLTYPQARGELGREILPPASRIVEISLPKQNNLPITAALLVKAETIPLPPAGGLYPHDLDAAGERLVLSWQQGPAAQVLLRLYARGMDPAGINAQRLCRELRKRSPEDPWLVDVDLIATRLAEGRFRVSYIRRKASKDLKLFPGEGEWFLESPFFTPLATEAEGGLPIKVSLGFHRLFNTHGGAHYDLYVEPERACWIRRE